MRQTLMNSLNTKKEKQKLKLKKKRFKNINRKLVFKYLHNIHIFTKQNLPKMLQNAIECQNNFILVKIEPTHSNHPRKKTLSLEYIIQNLGQIFKSLQ